MTPPVHAAQTADDDPLTRDAHHLSDALAQLIRVVQFRDRDRACCYGVSVSQCYALTGIVEAGTMTVNDLAAYLFLDKSTASRVANGLVEKGLIARQKAVTDGRVVLLVPTTAGLDVHARIEEDLSREYVELLRDFTPEVRSGVTTLVGRLGRSFASRVDTSNGACCSVG